VPLLFVGARVDEHNAALSDDASAYAYIDPTGMVIDVSRLH
jgi:hypothetical protein